MSSAVSVLQTQEGLDVAFQVGAIADQLICQICHGYFRKAATLKECLHTFCQTCVLRYLIQKRAACPICSAPVEGMLVDNVVLDTRIQALVDSLLPYFATEEQKMKTRLDAFLQGISLSPNAASMIYRPDSVVSCNLEAIPKATTNETLKTLKNSSSGIMLHVSAHPTCPIAQRLPRLRCPYLYVSGEVPSGLLGAFILQQLDGSETFKTDSLGGAGNPAPPPPPIFLCLDTQEMPNHWSLNFSCRCRGLKIGVGAQPISITYRFGRENGGMNPNYRRNQYVFIDR